MPVFHIGYLKNILQILQCICKVLLFSPSWCIDWTSSGSFCLIIFLVHRNIVQFVYNWGVCDLIVPWLSLKINCSRNFMHPLLYYLYDGGPRSPGGWVDCSHAPVFWCQRRSASCIFARCEIRELRYCRGEQFWRRLLIGVNEFAFALGVETIMVWALDPIIPFFSYTSPWLMTLLNLYFQCI
jgi:hypothetical protein